MINFFLQNLLWTQAYSLVIGAIVVFVVGYFFYKPLCYLSIAFFIFSLFFFRNPVRITPQDNRALIAPADGIVLEVDEQLSSDIYSKKISIFLSIFDVHVNWAPMSGTVSAISYHPGEFNLAYVPKSSILNERNEIMITHTDGTQIKMVQIAGTIARKIVCWVEPMQQVQAGQKVGMIRFGSRVDLYVPHNFTLDVAVNDRVYGGQTILGHRVIH